MNPPPDVEGQLEWAWQQLLALNPTLSMAQLRPVFLAFVAGAETVHTVLRQTKVPGVKARNALTARSARIKAGVDALYLRVTGTRLE